MSNNQLIHVDFNEPPVKKTKLIAKKIICPILGCYYKLLMNVFYPKNNSDKEYKVSVCSIFKDEGTYLKEWIEYHIIVGVEHFYLYNNKSSDNYLKILNPYINKGLVTLIDWPKPQSQMEAFSDCAERFSSQTKWIAYIDLDEFIVPNEANNIYDVVKRFEKNRPCVIAYWRYFGSSGIVDRNTKNLVTEDFVLGWEKYADLGKIFFNTKYIYNPGHRGSNSMHATWGAYKGRSLPPVNLFNKVCIYGSNPNSKRDMPIQINHYLLKSYNEFIERKSRRGGGVHGVGFHDKEYFYWHDEKSNFPDYRIYKFMVKLKEAMKEEIGN